MVASWPFLSTLVSPLVVSKPGTISLWLPEVSSIETLTSRATEYGLTAQAFEVNSSQRRHKTLAKINGKKKEVEQFGHDLYAKTGVTGDWFFSDSTYAGPYPQSRIPFAFVIVQNCKELEAVLASLRLDDRVQDIGILASLNKVLFEFVGSSEELLELLQKEVGGRWISDAEILIVRRQI